MPASTPLCIVNERQSDSTMAYLCANNPLPVFDHCSMNAGGMTMLKLHREIMKLAHTLYRFLISSHDDIQRIGIVAGMVRDGPTNVIYTRLRLGSKKATENGRRTHIVLANTRKVYYSFNIILLQQVLRTDPRSLRLSACNLSAIHVGPLQNRRRAKCTRRQDDET